MKKQWYEIQLISTIDSHVETIAKVKSKGLANIVYNQVKETYKNTVYLVHVK